MKKLLYKSFALLCAMMMFITTPVFAAETTDNTGSGNMGQENISDEEKEYWENVEWDTFDLQEYENEVTKMENMTEVKGRISLMYLEEVGGEWIQASDGRWWYRHTDGSYTTSSWEKINGEWYYFDKSGWMVTGWVYTDSTWYYCHEENGNWIDNTGTRMIQEAFKYVGGKYVYGGNNLATGVDCSGYVQQISKICGISTPRVSKDQYTASRKISYANLQPGDLVFFSSSSSSSTVSHVAFYVGKINGQEDMIVHAANSSSGIIISSMRSNIVGCGTYWR